MGKSLIILGSGPGGYVAAIRASQLGFAVTVVEKAELGGVCLNWGCIPTKSLLKSAEVLNNAKAADSYGIAIDGNIKPDFAKVMQRSRRIASQMSKGIEFLFTKNNITVVKGFGTIKDAHSVSVESEDVSILISADYILIATGARSRNLPNMPIDDTQIIGYKSALNLQSLPKTMLVAGSGAIGVELAYFYASMGTQVTLVEYLPRIVPLVDADVSEPLEKSLKKLKIKVLVSSEVLSVDKLDGKCVATIATPKGQLVVESDIVLSAVGIESNIEQIGLETVGIHTAKGKIVVDDSYKTSVDSIFAIGDVIGTPALAHVASAEALSCIETLAGHHKTTAINYGAIPSCIYTSPEIASVGITEYQAQEKNIAVTIGKFPFSALGKATAAGAREGFVKLIFDTGTHKLLGAHLVGHSVTEMLSELVLSINLDAEARHLLHSIHPHPTMSEAIMEAAAVAMGEAIHL